MAASRPVQAGGVTPFGRDRLVSLIEAERATYRLRHSASAALHVEASHLLSGVPMTWMSQWPGGFPIYVTAAKGATVTDVDGLSYIDFALGDTGAMAGHAPEIVVEAVRTQMSSGGITAMLPTENAEWVGAELSRRFGLEQWSFTLSATDANRWAIRLARLVTGKPRILVFSYCYHGSVDETFVVLDERDKPSSRPGNVGPAVDPTTTTRVAHFNDLDSVEAALAHGDVAAVVTEPALTNIGIVLPEPGFLEGVRELANRFGALLLIDETHTFSAGPSGMSGTCGLQPDILVIGKSIGGGIPCGAFGISSTIADVVQALASSGEADIADVGGVGGTLAGNALSTAAMRATLSEVLTADAFGRMIDLGTRYTAALRATIDEYRLPWSVTQL